MRRDDAIRILREHESEIRAEGVTRLGAVRLGRPRPSPPGQRCRPAGGLRRRGTLGSRLLRFGRFFSELLGAEAEVAERDRLKRFLKDAILSEALEIFPNPAHPPYYPDGVPVAKRSPRQALEDIKDAVLAIEEFTIAKTYRDFRSFRIFARL
jgi:hypothetical protein